MRIILDRTAKDMIGAEALDLASFESASGCVAILDCEGRIMELSDWSDAGFDHRSSALEKGQSYWAVWPADTHKALKRAVSRGAGGNITQYWSRYEHADGSITHWDIRLSPLHDIRDQVDGVLAVSRKLEEH